MKKLLFAAAFAGFNYISSASAWSGDMIGGYRADEFKMSWSDYVADTIGNQDGIASPEETKHLQHELRKAKNAGTHVYIPAIVCWNRHSEQGSKGKTDPVVDLEMLLSGSAIAYSRSQSIRNARDYHLHGHPMELDDKGNPRRLFVIDKEGKIHMTLKFYGYYNSRSVPEREVFARRTGQAGMYVLDAYLNNQNCTNTLPDKISSK